MLPIIARPVILLQTYVTHVALLVIHLLDSVLIVMTLTAMIAVAQDNVLPANMATICLAPLV